MEQIKAALKYPFAKWQRLFYWYLNGFVLVGALMVVIGFYGGMSAQVPDPAATGLFFVGILLILAGIVPSIAFMGYELEYMGAILKGKDKQLPKFGRFGKQLKRGFFVAAFSLIVGVVSSLSEQFMRLGEAAGSILYLLTAVILSLFTPVLIMQYVEQEVFENFFKIPRAWKILKKNVKSFIAMIIRVIAVSLVWIVVSIPIITLIVTIPAMQFSSRYLVAQWYRHAKKPKL